jgi:protein-disulfide isomerase
MKIDKYLLAGISILLVVAFAIGATWYRREEAARTISNTPNGQPASAPVEVSGRLVRLHSPTIGPADAAVTVVEFLDPECEACGAMHPIVKQLLEEFDGRIRLVVRYMPLHQNSAYAASLLEGARDQGKYWELMDVFLTRQPQWASHDAPRPELLLSYVKEMGLNVDAVTAVAKSSGTERRIQMDLADGTAVGVTGTPTFFVNGQLLTRLGHEPLRTAILAALRK